jgi:DNA-binding NarL/FixJ family response regulator
VPRLVEPGYGRDVHPALSAQEARGGQRGGEGKRLRLVIAEDNFLVREGIARVVAELDDVELVGLCADLDSLRATTDRLRPDVILVDIRMPPDYTDEGIRFAAELRETHPSIAVIVLSEHAEPIYASVLFQGGPARRGYLLKDQVKDPEDLQRGLHEVASGGALVDPRIVEKLFAVEHTPAFRSVAALTDREREILALIAAALTNAAIAARLGITVRGVERHINTIFTKLGLSESEDVSRRVKAALMFLASEGLLGEPS